MATGFQVKLCGEWRDYPPRENRFLVNAYLAGMPHAKFRLGQVVYQVKFKRPMKQVNLATGKVREMRPPCKLRPPAKAVVPAGRTRFVTVPKGHQGMTLFLTDGDGGTLTVRLDRVPKPGQTVVVPMGSMGAAALRARSSHDPPPPGPSLRGPPRGPSPRGRSPRGRSPRGRSPRGPSPRGQSLHASSPRAPSPRALSPRAPSPREPSPRPGDPSTRVTVAAAGAGAVAAGALVAGGVVLGETTDTADWAADAGEDVADSAGPALEDAGTWVEGAVGDLDTWLSDAAADPGDMLMDLF